MTDPRPAMPFTAEDLCALTVDVSKRTIAAIVSYELGRASMSAELQGPLDMAAIDQLSDIIGARILALDPTDVLKPTLSR